MVKKILHYLLQYSTVVPFKWNHSYMCFYCGIKLNDCQTLKSHTKEEHEDAKLNNVLKNLPLNRAVKLDVSEIKCKLCFKSFDSLEELLKHCSEDYGVKYDTDVIDSLLAQYRLSDDGMNCLQCDAKFQYFGPLLKHVHKTHKKKKLRRLCEVCGKGFVNPSNLEIHVLSAHQEKHSCEQCDKSFQSYNVLKQHMRDTHNNDALKCEKCGHGFASKYLLKRHLALTHDLKEFQYKCDVCSKIYTTISKLRIHKRRIHLNEKNVSCQICGLSFFDSDHLKRHMVKHTDARPFECDFCKKTFQRRKTLDLHRRIHTNDKRYACKECGRAFIQVTSLKLHIRVHHSEDKP